MAYSYKGSLSFGLVYIPIKLHLCVKSNDISFNMIDKNSMSRIQYKKTCHDCNGKEVKAEDIVKGYEYEDGKYVVFEAEDFEKIKTKKDKNITIENFVDIEEIDPIYYDKPYYVEATGGDKAFSLLIKAMDEEGKVGIAKTVLGTKEKLIAIRVKKGEMLLSTLNFADEIQKNPAKTNETELNKNELKLAKILIENMHSAFEPEKYKDEYKEKIQKAIESKIAGKAIIEPKEKDEHRAINLMDALQASLKDYSKKIPKAKTVKGQGVSV